ncbi:unnamed protein product, partial [Rotaria magnacalcarata]
MCPTVTPKNSYNSLLHFGGSDSASRFANTEQL